MKTTAANKFISVILSMSILASVSSCSSKKKEYKVIQSDDPWYDCETITVSDLYQDDDYEFLDFRTVGVSGDYVYVAVEGSKKMPEGINLNDLDEKDYYKYIEQSILEVSFDGTLKDKKDYFYQTPEGYFRFMMNSWVSDGRVNTLEGVFDTETGKFIEYYFNGEIYELPPVDNPYNYRLNLTNMYTTGGYTICFIDLKYGQTIAVVSPDGSLYEKAPYELVNSYAELYDIIPGEGNTVIIPAFTDDYDVIYVSFDLETGESKEITSLYGEGDVQVENASGKSIARDYEGFNVIDKQTGELNRICYYSDIDMSFEDAADSEVLYVSDSLDEIILANQKYDRTQRCNYNVYRITKSASNPNAGKTILTLSNADDSYPNSSDFTAVKLFNETNPSFFVKYVFPYDTKGEKIEVDADILLFDSPAADPSDRNKYVDLAPYLDLAGSSYEAEYFTNAIEAAKTDKALYRVPLDISISGIITASVNVPEGQQGFTFDQYLTFVNGVCNGIDPLSSTPGYKMGKSSYFTKLFTNMSEMFISNGKVDLSGDEFRELMQFVDQYGIDNEDDYFGEHSSAVNEIISSIETHNASLDGKLGAIYGTFYDFERYLECYQDYGEGLGIYGLPSFDGRGPQTTSYEFVSVLSDTKYPEACADFVKLLMSYEVQVTMTSGNPINRRALRSIAETELDYYNEMILLEVSEKPLSSDIIDKYENILSSSYVAMNIGDNIDSILREEASSYFSGSKSLDDVIPVMQNRIQTVLNENK